jgi:hypothetical protein
MGKNSGRSLRKRLLIALAAGGLVAGLLVVYQLLRLPVTAINSKPMAFYPVWGIGTCLAVTGGALIFTSTGRLAGRGVGLGMAGFPALAPGLFSLAVISLYNLMISQHTAGVAVYNPHMALLGFLAALPLLLVCLAAFLAINRCLKRVDIHYNNPIRTSQTVD